nr:NAD(P)-dependent oxidoreductase [Chloroflexota bacterium]
MSRLNDGLRQRHETGNPIRLALVGAGQMGRGMIIQIEQMMQGIQVVAVADIILDRVVLAYKDAGVSAEDIVVAKDAAAAEKALQQGKRVASDDAVLLTRLSTVEAVVEASGVPEVGAKVAFSAILNKKHIIMLNVETDVTVGYLLRRLADSAGVVYTVSAGDEPGAAKELYDFAKAMGFRIVAAGKGKNNPLDREATPDKLAAEAASKKMSAKMLTAFVDGTKTMVEMTALANATGLVPDVRGMHGPVATVEQLPTLFSLKSQGGILKREGVVDYALGAVAPGVFVIVTTDNRTVVEDLQYLHLGSGPNWVLYRPYHLANLETPLSVARAVLLGETTIATVHKPVAETITIAKRDLKAGEKLDGIGQFTFYGSIERADIAAMERLLPLGLAQGAVLKEDVAKGQPITYDQVELDRSSMIVHLRALQDHMD